MRKDVVALKFHYSLSFYKTKFWKTGKYGAFLELWSRASALKSDACGYYLIAVPPFPHSWNEHNKKNPAL